MESVMTPIGPGTLVGLSINHEKALIMHTRPKEERGPGIGNTYARWWQWDAEKKICYDVPEETGQGE